MNFLATPAKRRFLFAALYMSEGAPIGFLWWALPTILRSQGVSLELITTLTSILVLPWALKFLWAPLVDVLQTRWPLKFWILGMQALMGAFLLPLIWVNPSENFVLVFTLLLMHSLAAATQDVSIDALCIRVTSAHERGSLNGWMQTGMLSSRSLLGGGALILMESFGLPVVLLFLIAMIWLSSPLLIVSSIPRVQGVEIAERPFARFRSNLRSAFTRRSTWYALAFAAIAGAGYEASGAVAGPFLIDKGYSADQVGWFFLIPAVACMIVGSLLGGTIADRIPRTRAVRIFLISMAGSVLLLGGLDLGSSSGGWELYAGMSILYFCIGLFVSSSYALFMDLTDPDLGATQFSTYMGGTNLCESWSSFAIGRLAGAWGYAVGFFVMAAVSLGTLAILRKLDPHQRPLRS